jgi:hypothetical protein
MKIKETQQERDAWDMQCYGFSHASLTKYFDGVKDHTMSVASLMSDAQELIELGNAEDARKALNIAKFVLFNYIAKDAE